VIRRILIAVVVIAAVGVAGLYFPMDFLRPSVQRALERGLGRKVEIESVHLNLFGAPGLQVDGVKIHEDPRAGIEPFAYVDSLNAGIRWLSLFRGHLDFSSVNLGSATINLVKTDAGPWNFQLLLDDAARRASVTPSIKMRGGRVNFKYGDTKSVFYFDNADLDVAPSESSVELRFGGAPSRTDRTARDFGRFFIKGDWSTRGTPRVTLDVDLERSSLDEISRLIDARGFGLNGIVALQAQLSGAPSELQMTGQFQVAEVHRWDLLPQGGTWSVPIHGTLDLRAEKLELSSAKDGEAAPVSVDFRVFNLLSSPRWEAGVQLTQVPLATLLDVVRQTGAPLPDKLAAEGGVSGSVTYREDGGLGGRVELRDASLTLPDAQPLRASSAAVAIEEGTMRLEASTVTIGEKDSAEVEGSYSPQEPHDLDVRITTRGLNVADMRSFGLAAIPLLDQASQGTWRGWARYQKGAWSGEYEMQNARVAVEGLADPLRIQAAAVKLDGKRVAVSKLRARVGKIGFTGEYRFEPGTARLHRFNIAIDEMDAAELERLLAPTLLRERGGFLARTLGLAPAAAAPEWLKARGADGMISIAAIRAGDVVVNLRKARVLWDGTLLRLAGIDAGVEQGSALQGLTPWAAVSGELEADLLSSTEAPHYRFDGKVQDIPYKGGRVDLEGSMDAAGTGEQLLETARAEGHLRGRSVALSAESEFSSVAACFEWVAGRWKFPTVEVTLAGENYIGSGSSLADGRVVLDVGRGSRQVRFAGIP
jgi:hypothetical protein